MDSHIKLLDVVALDVDLPGLSLVRGQVGTVVEVLEEGVFAVEFADHEGQTYALETLRRDQLLPLRFNPEKAA